MAKNPYEINGNELYKKYYSTQAPAATGTTMTQVTPYGAQTATQKPASLSDLYSQIMNRQKFSYDVGSDPLYQQYKDRYLQQGQTAMRDTMGQAAALTGGYGSSYAQGVGQQAYDRYVQGLTDKIPELYSAAYSRYQDEGNNLMQQYALAKDKEDSEYSRAQNEYQRLYSLIGSTGYQPTDAELKAAGMTREIANRLRTIAIMKNQSLGNIDANGNYVAPPAPETPAYYGWQPKQAADNSQYYEDTVGELSQILRHNPGVNTSEIISTIQADKTLSDAQKETIIRSVRSSGQKSTSMN